MNDNKYWTAFYTKPRNEKTGANRLSSKGYEIYAPLRSTLKQWSDRKKKVQEPLFTSYIFARVNERERMEILQDPAVACSVCWLRKPVVIRNEEIDAIRQFLEEHPSAKASASSFRKGNDVKIEEGVFKGEGGIVKEIRNTKVVVQLKTLGIELSAELHPSKLKLQSIKD